jgi:hypothetical protein
VSAGPGRDIGTLAVGPLGAVALCPLASRMAARGGPPDGQDPTTAHGQDVKRPPPGGRGPLASGRAIRPRSRRGTPESARALPCACPGPALRAAGWYGMAMAATSAPSGGWPSASRSMTSRLRRSLGAVWSCLAKVYPLGPGPGCLGTCGAANRASPLPCSVEVISALTLTRHLHDLRLCVALRDPYARYVLTIASWASRLALPPPSGFQGAPRSATSAASRRVRGSSPLTLTRPAPAAAAQSRSTWRSPGPT